MKVGRVLRIALLAINAALLVASIVASLFLPELPGLVSNSLAAAAGLILLVGTLAALGYLVTRRFPRNSIGWLFFGLSVVIAFGAFAEQYTGAALAGASLPGYKVIGWILTWTLGGPGFFGFFVFFFLLFPTGHLPSRRWRAVGLAAGAAMASLVFGSAFGTETFPDLDLANPFSIEPLVRLRRFTEGPSFLLLMVCLIISFASLIVRFRRGNRDERQQLKWLMVAAGFFAFIVVLGPTWLWPASPRLDWLWTLLLLLGVGSIPVAASFAILRYRLYDIDVVINKTVVYGGLAAFITAVYVGVVVGIGALVGASDKPNLGLSLAATAIVAVAFQPVRERVQRFANKLVYGERVTPYEAITGFSHRMAESLSLDSVLPQMAEAAARGVAGVRSRVKLLLPAGAEQVVTWPDGSSEDSFDRTLAVVHQGEEMGEIAVSKAPGEQINSSEEKLLADLASQAGLAMRNLRLTAELQQRLVELQASRQRIVKAQDEERRRMERDIHDGAQQQLVSMSVKLGLLNNLLSRDAEKAGAMLEELRSEASEAVETLRDLARGLFPEILTEQGLCSALESHVTKMGLDATVEGEIGRFDLEIEANVYFCIREALQNASKHAPGVSITITLENEDGGIAFSVKDEGVGFDPSKVKLGSGLQNMRDRIEALGGILLIESNRGAGARIRGHVRA